MKKDYQIYRQNIIKPKLRVLKKTSLIQKRQKNKKKKKVMKMK